MIYSSKIWWLNPEFWYVCKMTSIGCQFNVIILNLKNSSETCEKLRHKLILMTMFQVSIVVISPRRQEKHSFMTSFLISTVFTGRLIIFFWLSFFFYLKLFVLYNGLIFGSSAILYILLWAISLLFVYFEFIIFLCWIEISNEKSILGLTISSQISSTSKSLQLINRSFISLFLGSS